MVVAGVHWMLVSVMAVLPHTCVMSLVRVNSGVQVARGRSVFVTDKELQFNMDQTTDSCKVEVVLNEPVTQRVGKLTPQVRIYSFCVASWCHNLFTYYTALNFSVESFCPIVLHLGLHHIYSLTAVYDYINCSY